MIRNNSIWVNPFEKSLLEDWHLEEFPQNYKDMIACFFPPDFMDKLKGTDIKPKIIMGGRGTGKSHILRMLTVQSVINRRKLEKVNKQNESFEIIKLKLEDYKEPFFGVYLKTTCLTPLSFQNVPYLNPDQLSTLNEHLFNMQLGIAILNSVKYFIANIEDLNYDIEGKISSNLSKKFGKLIQGNTIEKTMHSLRIQVKIIQKIIKEYPWYKDLSRYEDKILFTTAPDFIIELYEILSDHLLEDKVLFVLLDEFDELDLYQQKFINRLIRTRKIVFKIASKIGGIKTLEYIKGKELDEIHDYDPIIPLHFDTSPSEINIYKKLLKNIFIKRLTVYGNYKITDPKILLPSPKLSDENITEEELVKEFQVIRSGFKKKHKIIDSEKYWKNFRNHYREAAIYRILRKKHKDKIHAGFNNYARLSSGIVRQFILLCREVFNKAHRKNVDIENGSPINIKMQSKQVSKISHNQLYLELAKSIPANYGSKLVRFILDLGRILQNKLYFSSEPEANRFEIIDSLKFKLDKYTIPRKIIEYGMRMPHLISETAFKPKQPAYAFSFTFSLNAIFTPVLKIPSGKRWRTPLKVDEINRLCSGENRNTVLKEIINSIKIRKRSVRKEEKLEKEELKEQRTLYDVLDQPINLNHCPITGYGCDKNLINYYIQKNNFKAFLGIPFNQKSWIYDIREWIKNLLGDTFNIGCVDIDDFPHFGKLLCKICACLRQMPIGFYEITELNPNVIFELGMGTALNKINFLLVYPEKIPEEYKVDFPPKPLEGIEYIPYKYGQNEIISIFEKKVIPTIKEVIQKNDSYFCRFIKIKCPEKEITIDQKKILIALPYENNEPFFNEVKKIIKESLNNYKTQFFKKAETLSDLCQLCQKIKESSFIIVDTSYNNLTMLFALGIAFGKDKQFIQLHNIDLSEERPISDIRPWAIEYRNLEELKRRLDKELKFYLGDYDER